MNNIDRLQRNLERIKTEGSKDSLQTQKKLISKPSHC